MVNIIKFDGNKYKILDRSDGGGEHITARYAC